MPCLIGPVFVYWSDHPGVLSRWLLLKAAQETPDTSWQYTAFLLNEALSDLEPCVLNGPLTAYVADRDKAQSYALFLEPTDGPAGSIKCPMRVIFAKQLQEYHPRPFGEFWQGVSSEYWLASRAHRSLTLEHLYPDKFQPYSNFEALQPPTLPEANVKEEEESVPSLSLDELLDQLQITSFEYSMPLPFDLKNNCLYFTHNAQGKVQIAIAFYPGVVLERVLTSQEESLPVVTQICLNQDQDLASELSDVDCFHGKNAPYEVEELGSLGESVQNFITQQFHDQDELNASLDVQTPGSSVLDESAMSFDEKRILNRLEDLLWGLSHEERHTVIAVLAPDWILNDAHRMGLTQKEQQIVIAYLLKRVKAQQELPLFWGQQSKNDYLAQNPYADYVIWDPHQPQRMTYVDILGRYECWPLAEGSDVRAYLEQEERGLRPFSIEGGYCFISEEVLAGWLPEGGVERVFPRSFHVLIDNFIQQYLLPSGVASLFARQWSSPSNSPCVGVIDTYYQYILLLALRRLGYDGLFERSPLNELTARQKICDLQQHFGVERLIYQGLSQRGTWIYQRVMGALYSPENLRNEPLEELDNIASICELMLQNSPADSDIFEASNDILASIAVLEEGDNIFGLSGSAADAYQEGLNNILDSIDRYRFFRRFENAVRSKCSQEYYQHDASIAIQRVYSLIEEDRVNARRSEYQPTEVWLLLLEACYEMLAIEPENKDIAYTFFIIKSELSCSYCQEYPTFFFEWIKGKEVLAPLPTVLRVIALLSNVPEGFEVPMGMQALEKKYRPKRIALEFFKSMLEVFFQNPTAFKEVAATLHMITTFTPEEQSFYQSIFDYIIFSDRFYQQCANPIFSPVLAIKLREYCNNITPLLHDFAKTRLLYKVPIHFFYDTRAEGNCYPISAPVLAVLTKELLLIDNNNSEMWPKFKECFICCVNNRLSDLQECAEKELWHTVTTQDRPLMVKNELRTCCSHITSLKIDYFFKILPHLYYDEIKEVVQCFKAVAALHNRIGLVMEFCHHFITLLETLSYFYQNQKTSEAYRQLLIDFYENNTSLLENLSDLSLLKKETLMSIAERYWDNSHEVLVINIALADAATQANMIEPLTCWHQIFQKKSISSLEAISARNLRELMIVLKSPIDTQNLKYWLSAIIVWDTSSLFEVMSATPCKNWPLISEIVAINMDIWHNKFAQDHASYGELCTILKVLPQLADSGIGNENMQAFNMVIDILNERVYQGQNTSFFQKLFQLVAQCFVSQRDCDTILKGTESWSTNELPTQSYQPGFIDTGSVVTASSRMLILRALREAFYHRKITLSIKNCDAIGRSFIRRAPPRLPTNFTQQWLEVYDLPKTHLIEWLGFFTCDLAAMRQLIPFVMKLPSVQKGYIDLWDVFADLKWHQKACYGLLKDAGYTYQGCLSSSLQTPWKHYVVRKSGMVCQDFSMVQQGLSGQHGFVALCEYLQKNHLVFVQEWVPLLMEYMQAHPQLWVNDQLNFSLGVAFIGFDKMQQFYVDVMHESDATDKLIPGFDVLNLRDKRTIQIVHQELEALFDNPQEAFSIQRLHQPWQLYQRIIYFDDNINKIRELLRPAVFEIDTVCSLFAGLTEKEADTFIPDLQAAIDRMSNISAQNFFRGAFYHTARSPKIITQLEQLPPIAQIALLKKAFSQEVFPSEGINAQSLTAWKDFFFHLISRLDNTNNNVDILSEKFEILLEQYGYYHTNVQKNGDLPCKDSPFDSPHRTLWALWEISKQRAQRESLSSESLIGVIDIIKVINTQSQLLMQSPNNRELVHDVFRLATPELIDFWDINTYHFIDTAEIFEEVFFKLSEEKKEYLWEVCSPHFEAWVQDSDALLQLLRCADKEQQRALLKRFPFAHDWIRGAKDFCALLDVFIDIDTVADIIKAWPIHRFMSNMHDYIEILQQARAFGVGSFFLQKYRDEFYAASSKAQPLNIEQWQRLDCESCDLIVMIERFSQSHLGHRLVEALVYAEGLSDDDDAQKEEGAIAITNILNDIVRLYGQEAMGAMSDYWRQFTIKTHTESAALSLLGRNDLFFSQQQSRSDSRAHSPTMPT